MNRKNQTRKPERERRGDGHSHIVIPKEMKRVHPPCPHYEKCGGCQLQELSYPDQCKVKENYVNKLFQGYAKVSEFVSMEEPYYYRNKVHVTFSENKKNEIIGGIYEEGTHTVKDIPGCLIQNPVANQISKTLIRLAKEFKIRAYQEDRGVGFLRHALIRVGFYSKEVMVVLVTASPLFKSKNAFLKKLLEAHPEITTVCLNINDKKTSMVLGEKEQVLYGKGYIEDTLMGLQFRISAKSFYQINPIQTEKLYERAISMGELSKEDVVVDAYCGTGTIGLLMSPHVKRVIGVEYNKDAVRDAISNAKRNKVENALFVQADAGDWMRQVKEEGEKLDVVFLDPPRMGASESFLHALGSLSPKKIVYISCNPNTQKRDVEFLTQFGYRVKKLVAVDLFCQTNHCEVVCLLQRNER